ncbi:MAG TPA: hypothetical protein VGC97_08680 [Pyrinomonadaceae bacterium]
MTINNTNLNFDQLETIAADSIAKLETSNRPDRTRWINAIKKAVTELQANPFWNFDGTELIMMSTTSNTTYQSNGTCQCISYTEHKMPCRHRAAARLLARYAETA